MGIGNGHIPLIRLHGNLIVSIQVSLTDGLVAALQDDVTRAIAESDVAGLIIDLSGVDLMDSYISRAVRDLALTARLMGVDTVVCGMRPAVVMTLVEMGLDVPGVTAALHLEHALEILREHASWAEIALLAPRGGGPSAGLRGALGWDELSDPTS
ncbi:STAS domain-containing protein [Polyangium aurulentum]|uniref:STAS domain-containing protein n=1 Tax=Polyangium aurulentum TaxID=2567896 RepID=UPI001F169B75|nr:STAS domain-containing protein [Polyangium aurulentum]